MFSFPSSVVLSWPLPSDDPLKRGAGIWVVTAMFLLLTVICLFLRLWARAIIRRWIGVDDILITLAFVFSIVVTALNAVGSDYYGWDRHLWEIDMTKVSQSLKVLYFARIFWGISSSLVRLSVLILLYRLVDSSRAPTLYRTILHYTTAFNAALLVYYLISGIFPCIPIRAYWEAIPSRCLNDSLSMEVAAVVNTLSEIFLATLPLLAVFRLVDRKQRWETISVLSLGYFVALAGCFRTYYIFKAITSYDLTWYSEPQWACSEAEIDISIICACAVSLKPFLNRRLNRGDGITSIHTDMEPHSNIDIEGISTNGYGYSVTISGPSTSDPSSPSSNHHHHRHHHLQNFNFKKTEVYVTSTAAT